MTDMSNNINSVVSKDQQLAIIPSLEKGYFANANEEVKTHV